jgi:uncharacterized protein YprB with RNaseH-like and TPR domain
MSIPESRRKKLAMLLRARAQGQLVSGAELLASHGHTGINRSTAGTAPATHRAPSAEPMGLEVACPGEEVVEAVHGGTYWLVRRTLAEVENESLAIAQEYSSVLRGARHGFDELGASAALCHAANALPGDLLFMDTETCGLSGAMIFLVGLMFHEGGQLVFEQHLARHYGQEEAILRAFARRYEQCGVLVSFNGKAFDMTQIRERWAFHGIEPPWTAPPHLDLLHEARRRWKGQVRSFRLQSLERQFCRRHRVGDIPGSAIPGAYHEFVRTGDARQIRDILHHNLLDLLTMAQLVTILLTGCDPVTE